MIEASFNIIENNLCNNNDRGILIFQAHSNTIANNTCNSNSNEGIEARSHWLRNDVINNTCVNNQYGIRLNGSSRNVIANNTCQDNSYGVHSSVSAFNFIFHNNIINNTIQAYESPSVSIWNNSQQEGNFWSDYSGLDNGASSRIAGDGIGDTNIPHLGFDNYPFMNPWGWLYPGTTDLLDPGDTDSDGNYSLTWSSTPRAIGYILEEDEFITFNSPITVYNGPSLTSQITNNDENTYYYRLKAYNEHYESQWSNIVDMIVDYIPPTPQSLQVSVYPYGNALNISWDKNQKDTVEYDLFFRTDGNWQLLNSISHPIHTYNHTDLNDGQNYYYKILARDSIGQVSDFSSVEEAVPADSRAPLPPNVVTISQISHNSIKLSWMANTENDLVGYYVYRSYIAIPSDWGNPINGATPITNEIYIDDSLDELTTYHYVITALDEVPNESDYSDMVHATTLLGPHAPEINNSLSDFEMTEDTYNDLSINLYHWFKDINNDLLVFRCEGQDNIGVTIYDSNGTVALKPELNWNGIEPLTFFASDDTNEISDVINITVTAVNDPPGLANIVSPSDGEIVNDGKFLNFRGDCSDPDIDYGDELDFKWLSNLSGELGQNKILPNIRLPIGSHMIILEAKDKMGETSTTSINVTVLEIPASDTDEDGMPNIWERENGLDPQDPTDAGKDPDGDGKTNLEEYLAGTNPNVDETIIDDDTDDTIDDPDDIPDDIDDTDTTDDDTNDNITDDSEQPGGQIGDTTPINETSTPSKESSSLTLLAIIIAVLVVALLATLWFLKKPPFAKAPPPEVKPPVRPPLPGQLLVQPPLQAQPSAQPPPIAPSPTPSPQPEYQPEPEMSLEDAAAAFMEQTEIQE